MHSPFNASRNRREFLQASGKLAMGAGLSTLLPAQMLRAEAVTPKTDSTPESLTKVLYDTLSPKQRETICFDWDHTEKGRGLLRTHVSANWDITDEYVNSEFYTDEQREIVRHIFEGIIQPEWHERIDKQLDDDSDGFGEQNSIAIFGEPGSEQCEFVLTGRHMTLRADGAYSDGRAFGGPIFYGHAAEAFDEEAHHPGNVFWSQAQAANKLYQMLDGEQQQAALVRKGMPGERDIAFEGAEGKFQGIPVGQLASDQQEHMQQVLAKLIEPYRSEAQREAMDCLTTQGGLQACHLAYYAQDDIGGDGVWDNWRLEGPSFVWHYRGAPHVHVWVNVADKPKGKINVG